MTPWKLPVTLLVFLGFLPARSDAAISTGIEFLRACSATVKQADGLELFPEEQVLSVYCLGYMSGFTDSVRLTNHFYKPKNPGICLPEKGASNEQLIRIITKWLKEHPDTLHQTARMDVLLALQNAFPCK